MLLSKFAVCDSKRLRFIKEQEPSGFYLTWAELLIHLSLLLVKLLLLKLNYEVG